MDLREPWEGGASGREEFIANPKPIYPGGRRCPLEKGGPTMTMDQVWRAWMDAILIYGPNSDKAKEMEAEYCQRYLEVHEQFPKSGF